MTKAFHFYFRVRKQVVNIPSFVVRLDSQKHIDFALTSPYGGGRAGKLFRLTVPYIVRLKYEVDAL